MSRYIREFFRRITEIIFRYQKIMRFVMLMIILYIGYLQIGFVLTAITFSNIYLHESRINFLEEKIKKKLKSIEKSSDNGNQIERIKKELVENFGSEKESKEAKRGKRGPGRPRKTVSE